jgi:uncharacterized protein YecE (DUF72 family)
MELYLGTGGYSNDDWIGLLYPPGTKPADYLKVYAKHFNAVELNSSFYAIPGLKAFEGMVKKSEAKVRFSVKIPQEMTHKRDADDELYKRLLESVQPLRDVGMLGPFLAQFPYSFHRTPENRLYLKTLVEKFATEHLAVEFRHGSWDNDDVREGLKTFKLISVSVDYPPLPGLPKSTLHLTSDIAYVRMHGRNKEKWWDGKDQGERHDYEYSPDELKPWVLQIKEREDELSQMYIMMQNTTKGHALKNLKMLKELFDEVGLEANVNY